MHTVIFRIARLATAHTCLVCCLKFKLIVKHFWRPLALKSDEDHASTCTEIQGGSGPLRILSFQNPRNVLQALGLEDNTVNGQAVALLLKASGCCSHTAALRHPSESQHMTGHRGPCIHMCTYCACIRTYSAVLLVTSATLMPDLSGIVW